MHPFLLSLCLLVMCQGAEGRCAAKEPLLSLAWLLRCHAQCACAPPQCALPLASCISACSQASAAAPAAQSAACCWAMCSASCQLPCTLCVPVLPLRAALRQVAGAEELL